MNTDKPSLADSALASFDLRRYPQRPREQLQAWNNADRLLLEYAREHSAPALRILAVNDEFGALAIALAGSTVWTDSQLAIEAIQRNAQRLDRAPVSIIPAGEMPQADFELVLLRIPKQLSLLRYQLDTLQRQLAAGTRIVCAGMDKHLPRDIAASIETIVGPTERHRGQYKARLFTAQTGRNTPPVQTSPAQFECDQLGASIETFPNVFSGDHLDPGSSLLLQQFPQLPPAHNIVDLGCGSGVLGLVAMSLLPAARLFFLDESDLAVASARHNVSRLFPDRLGDTSFLRTDGFRGYRGPAPDLVLCNPPFINSTWLMTTSAAAS